MKRLVSSGLMIALIVSAFAVVSPTANGQGTGLVSSVLSRMEKNRQNLKSLRAGINVVKYNSQLGVETDKYSGVVIYMPTGGRHAAVRIDWTNPRKETLAVNNDRYTLFRPSLKVAYTGHASKMNGDNKAGSLLEMMNMSRAQLETRFQPLKDVREETLWGGVGTIHLTLVPKGKASYKYAEVWIDNSGMPVQTKIVEKNNDSTTMRLTGLQKNAPVSSSDFDVKLDSNVKIVKS